MKQASFLKWAEAYYGPYRPVVKAEVAGYLQRAGEQEIEALRRVLVRRYSTAWGRPPDVAKLLELREEVNLHHSAMVTQERIEANRRLLAEAQANPEVGRLLTELREKIQAKRREAKK